MIKSFIFLSIFITGISCFTSEILKPLTDPLNSVSNAFFDCVRRVRSEREVKEFVRFDYNKMSVDMMLKATSKHIGFSILLAVGLFYVVCILLSGFFVFICRCCGKCGSRPPAMDPPKASCKRGLLAVVLFVLIMAQVLSAFMIQSNNTIIYRELRSNNSNENLFYRLTSKMNKLQLTLTEYKAKLDAVKLDSHYTTRLEKAVQKYGENISVVLNQSLDDLSSQSAFKKLIESATSVKSKLTESSRKEINVRFTKMRSDLTNVASEFDALKNEINKYKCTDESCKKGKEAVQKIQLQFYHKMNDGKYKRLIDKFTNDAFVNELESIINMKSRFNTSNEKFIKTLKTYLYTWKEESKFKEVISFFNKLLRTVKQFVGTFAEQLNEKNADGSVDLKMKILKYDSYRFFAWLTIFLVVVLICVMFFIGFLFGVLGKRSEYENQCCTKNVGARFLMIGVGISFLVAPILMVITISFMTSLGLVQSEICQYARPEIKIGPAVLDAYIDRMMSGISDDNSVSSGYARSVLLDCKDKNVISAFMNAILIHSKYFENETNHWKSFNYNSLLNDMKQINTDIASSESLSKIYIDKMKVDLTEFSEAIKYFKKDEFRSNLTLHKTNLAKIKQEMNSIQTEFRDWELFKLADTSKQFVEYTSSFIMKWAKKIKTTIWFNVNQMFIHVLSIPFKDVKCASIRKSILSLVNFGCYETLSYLNGSWYGLGLFLLLVIPTIIVAMILDNLYRRIQHYYQDKQEPDYDHYIGFYARADGEHSHDNNRNKPTKKKGKKTYEHVPLNDRA